MFWARRKNLRYLQKKLTAEGFMGGGSNYLKRGISYFRRNGLARSFYKAAERLAADRAEKDYRPCRADEETILAQRNRVFDNPYRFSILVPVYETDPVLFREMLDSVGEQTYGNWELILADASADESRRSIVRDFMEEYDLVCKDRYGTLHDKVVYLKLDENKGIAGNTNEALSHASGDYVGLLDHDDILENTALFDIMSAIEQEEHSGRTSENIRKVMAVYTDEDKVSEDGKVFFDPNRKPSFDPVLLCTNNYICHFFVADADLAKGTGGFDPEYDGAQDHDFILRCTEGIKRDLILHIPKVLYHWRSSNGSTAENPDAKLYAYEAGKRAVKDHFKRAGIKVNVSDSPHLGFFELEYEDYTGSSDDLLMILADDLRPEDERCIDIMKNAMSVPGIGAVTGKIIGKDGRVESAGFDTDEEGNPVARCAGLKRHYSGYMHRASLDRLSDDFSPDCVLLRRDAVKEMSPKIVLKDGFDIYYMHRAEFTRKAK